MSAGEELLRDHWGHGYRNPPRELTAREAFDESDLLQSMIADWWRDRAATLVDTLAPEAFSTERRERLIEIAEVAARGHRDPEAAVMAAIAVYLVGATPVVIA